MRSHQENLRLSVSCRGSNLCPLSLSTTISYPLIATTTLDVPIPSPHSSNHKSQQITPCSATKYGKLFPKRLLPEDTLKTPESPPSLLQVRITKPPALAATSNLMRNPHCAGNRAVGADIRYRKDSPATSGLTLTRDQI